MAHIYEMESRKHNYLIQVYTKSARVVTKNSNGDKISFSKVFWLKQPMDLEVLRRSISAKASNSWVKAKKKINQGDVRIGQKSLFHSLRIVMYGCQIAEYGQIVDYQCANKYWDIIKKIEDWELLKEKFQPLKNQLNSKFRKLAPIKK